MKKNIRLFLFAATLFTALVGDAHALEYKAVGNDPAIMYDAPSVRGRKVFIAPRGMPVEVVLTYGDWTKVRDATGGLAWMESKALVNEHNVVVRVPQAIVRAAPDESSAIVFTAEKGVLMQLLDASNPGWLQVRHRDGLTGYVQAASVWGR